MKDFFCASALVVVCAIPGTTVYAQTPTTTPAVAAPASTPIATAVAPNILRQGTQIRLTVVTGVNSKENKVGNRVDFQVADDVLVNGKTVIARGTSAFGELTMTKKSGSFGKKGKLEGRLLYIKTSTDNLPITGTFDDKGKAGTAGTVAVAVVAGVFSAFVKGKNAYMEAGTEVTGTLERDVSFPG